MTTAREVKAWLRPLLERRSDLTLVGRNLVFAPFQHVVRGIYFDASSDRNSCRPKWYVNTVCQYYYGPKAGFSFQFCGDIFLKRTDDPDFIPDLATKLDAALELDFSEVLTLGHFLERTDPNTLNGNVFVRSPLSQRPFSHAVVLAALGRLSEARNVFKPAVERRERARQAHLDVAEAEFSKRPDSAAGKLNLEWAERDSCTLARLQPFGAVLELGDRAGIARLLHEWEAETVAGWSLEHLWERSPFPVELGIGD